MNVVLAKLLTGSIDRRALETAIGSAPPVPLPPHRPTHGRGGPPWPLGRSAPLRGVRTPDLSRPGPRTRSATDTMHYMSTPLSIRFDPEILERLRRRARAVPGATPSGLAGRLVDEGLRMAEHPGILFKNGPSGRRAALALGPDVWEVVKASREMDERGEAAVRAVAELLNLAGEQVRAALRYYADHQGEVDAEIALADEESAQAEKAWMVQQRLLA